MRDWGLSGVSHQPSVVVALRAVFISIGEFDPLLADT
jgi:hypothetical protein